MGNRRCSEFPRDIRAGDVYEMLAAIYQLGEIIMSALDDLTTQVAANTSAEGAAVTLIQGLADELKKAIAASPASNDAALVDLAAKLHASADALGAAVVANTPVAPTPAPVVTPVDPGTSAPAATV